MLTYTPMAPCVPLNLFQLWRMGRPASVLGCGGAERTVLLSMLEQVVRGMEQFQREPTAPIPRPEKSMIAFA